MKVIVERIEPFETVIARLRAASLDETGGREIPIFKDASIRLVDFLPDEVNVSSLYVIRERIKFQRELRDELISRYGIDPFQLPGMLHLRINDGELTGMAPPVVETFPESVTIASYENENVPPPSMLTIPFIQDGIHRVWNAREDRLPVRCFFIQGALSAHRPYAFPNSWSEVKVYDVAPPVKKNYRRLNPYTFMRPFRVVRQTSDMPPAVEWGRKK